MQTKDFEQKLQTATRQTKYYKVVRPTRFVQDVNVSKKQKPQELQCLNMFSVPNLFSFVLAIILTSVSIPFINCYSQCLPFFYKNEHFHAVYKKK